MDVPWYDDKEVKWAMMQIGMVELESGHWLSPDGLKELVDFDGGAMMTTRLWLDRPEFDVTTIHHGTVRDAAFINTCLKEHIDEIKRRTEEIHSKGLDALKDRIKS